MTSSQWVPTTLGTACEINPPRPKLASLSDETQVLFVPMAAVDDVRGEITGPETRPLGEVRDKSFRTFSSNDVLFAKITPCMENGKAAIAPDITNGLGFGSTEFHILRPNKDVSARFIWHFVRQQTFRKLAEEQMTGTVGQARVPADFLRNFPIDLPPRPVQDLVADRLDRATEAAQNAEVHLRTALETVRSFRRAILAAACAGRLTEDWRRSNPEAESLEHALLERQSSRTEKSRRVAEQFIDLAVPSVPASYVVTTLGACADLIEYGTSKKCDQEESKGVPVLRMGNIQDGFIDYSDLKYCDKDDEVERLTLHDGDLLFNRTNSPELVGKSAVFHRRDRMSFASYLIRVRFARELADPDYVNYWVNSAWGREWARLAKTDGVSQSNINGSKLALMPIPLPPIDEQRVIVERASRMLAKADAIESQVRSIARLVEKSSYAVLAKAFRGELLNGSVDSNGEAGTTNRVV